MKTYQKRVKVLAAASLLVFGVFSGSVLAQVTNSKHDLSSGSTSTSKSTTSTTEICVFCHTPHGAEPLRGPLWNRSASGLAYTTLYANAESMDSVILAPSTSSVACLSCHDGNVAMNALLNAPGSGNPSTAGYAWAAAGTGIVLGKITGVANLTNDLSNDHPIGVAYCGGFKSGGGCVDGDFFTATANKTLLKDGVAAAADANGVATTKWWIETGVDTTRAKTDLVLFSRNFVLNTFAGYQPSVECATCHDVHGGVASTTFLRKTNDTSGLCLTCHNK